MENLPKISELFDLSHTLASSLLSTVRYPWEILPMLSELLLKLQASLPGDEYVMLGEGVLASRSARISPSAVLLGPTVIGRGSEVRPGAYLRGNVLVGDDCVVGNSTELKSCILFDGVQVPHYNYVGDSILGYRAHFGAGAIASNVRGDRGEVTVHAEAEYPTGLKKLGAMVGDLAEIGCHSVLCPGTVIGRRTQVYPLVRVRGVIAADRIVKDAGTVALREVRV